jgi:hypothetical protein
VKRDNLKQPDKQKLARPSADQADPYDFLVDWLIRRLNGKFGWLRGAPKFFAQKKFNCGGWL